MSIDSKKCGYCGKIFSKAYTTSKKRWGEQMFCSSVCANTSRRGKPSWNRGKKRTWKSPGDFKRGHKPWNKDGIHPSIVEDGNHNWKGEGASLVAKHAWVVRRLGRPKKCSHCGLDDPKRMYHWSNISGKYFRDVTDYQRLCVPCHKKYDLERLNNGG